MFLSHVIKRMVAQCLTVNKCLLNLVFYGFVICLRYNLGLFLCMILTIDARRNIELLPQVFSSENHPAIYHLTTIISSHWEIMFVFAFADYIMNVKTLTMHINKSTTTNRIPLIVPPILQSYTAACLTKPSFVKFIAFVVIIIPLLILIHLLFGYEFLPKKRRPIPCIVLSAIDCMVIYARSGVVWGGAAAASS